MAKSKKNKNKLTTLATTTISTFLSTTTTPMQDEKLNATLTPDEVFVPAPLDYGFYYAGAAIFFFVSLPGFLFNLYVLVSVARKKGLTSFLFLCGSKAFYNLLICSCFLFFSVPTSIIQPESETLFFINVIIGNLLGGGIYIGGMLVQVLASFNRLVATFSIYYYKIWCSLIVTAILTVMCFIGIFGWSTFLYFTIKLRYYYHTAEMIWYGDMGDEDADWALWMTGILVYIFSSIMLVGNLITFGKLFRDTMKNKVLSNAESSKRMKKNRLLFIQKVCQDLLYVIDMSFVQVFALMGPPTAWWFYVCYSAIWITMTTCDGLVMIVFTKDLSEPIKNSRFVRKIRGKKNEIVTRWAVSTLSSA